jgi:hypothetical protein
MQILSILNAESTVEVGLLIAVAGLLVGLLVHISNSITALAYREGKAEEKIHHLTLDMAENKGELRKIFQYLLTQSGFKESLNRRPRD